MTGNRFEVRQEPDNSDHGAQVFKVYMVNGPVSVEVGESYDEYWAKRIAGALAADEQQRSDAARAFPGVAPRD